MKSVNLNFLEPSGPVTGLLFTSSQNDPGSSLSLETSFGLYNRDFDSWKRRRFYVCHHVQAGSGALPSSSTKWCWGPASQRSQICSMELRNHIRLVPKLRMRRVPFSCTYSSRGALSVCSKKFVSQMFRTLAPSYIFHSAVYLTSS